MDFTKFVLVIFCCVFALDISNGQVVGFGKCVRPKVQPNFDATRYLGRWYEVQSYTPIYFQLNNVCVFVDYSDLGYGIVGVFNRGVEPRSMTQNRIRGRARQVENAKLKVEFGGVPDFTPPGNPEGNYWVLETDY